MQLLGSFRFYKTLMDDVEWRFFEGLVAEASSFRDLVVRLTEAMCETRRTDGLLCAAIDMITIIGDRQLALKMRPVYAGHRLYDVWMLWARSFWDASVYEAASQAVRDIILSESDTWIRLMFIDLALMLVSERDMKRAMEYVQQGLALAGESEDYVFARVRLLRHLALLYWLMGEYDKGDSMAQESIDLARKYDDELHLPPALNALSLNRPAHETLPIFEEMLEIATRHDLEIQREVALNNIGFTYLVFGEYTKAIRALEGALEAADAIGLPVFHPYLNLAAVYANLGDIDSALANAEKAVEVSRVTEPDNANAYLIMARALALKHRFEEAFDYLETGGEIAHRTGSPRYQAHYYLVRGVYELERGNLGPAKRSFERALRTAQRHRFERFIVRSLLYLAEVAVAMFVEDSDQAHVDEASEALGLLEKIADEQELVGLAVQVAVVKAQTDIMLKDVERARSTLEKALRNCQEFGLDRLRGVVEKQLERLDTYQAPDSLFQRFRKFVRQISMLGIRTRRIKFRVLGTIVILGESGIEVFAKYLDDRLVSDPSLVAGLITAVSNFARELRQDSRGQLQSIVHEDIAVLLEHRAGATCALLCDRDCSEARLLEREFLSRFTDRYADELERFGDGFAERLPADDLFEEVLSQWRL